MKSALIIAAVPAYAAYLGLFKLNPQKPRFADQPMGSSIGASRQQLAQEYHGGVTENQVNIALNSHLVRATGVYLVTIDTFMNQYSFTITIGTPAQKFNVLLDTSSGDFWVMSRYCDILACSMHSKYNSSASSTYRKNGAPSEIPYTIPGSFSHASGFVSNDDVSVGEIKLQKQDFAEVTSLSKGRFNASPYDGVFGLANVPSIGGVISPFQQMVQERLLEAPVFALYLGDHTTGEGAEVTFGGSDPSRHSTPLIALPVVSKTYWTVALNLIVVGNDVEHMNMRAILDSAISFNVVPVDVAKRINLAIGATQDSTGQYTIDCDKRTSLPDIAFTLGGVSFAVGPDAYIMAVKDKCISTFMGMDIPAPIGPVVILGNGFLRTWYSVYDLSNGRRILLAKAI